MVDNSPVQRFLNRVRQAHQSGAKDIRLTMVEATELTATIAQIVLESNSNTKATSSSSGIDGGTF